MSKDIRSWLGIPYAEAKRFQSPKLLEFDENRSYDAKGPAPLQAGDTGWLEADGGISEDCLNLNVWAPKNKDKKSLPVVVYIFGGGWVMGSNTQTTSNAAGLAKTCRAIGVSINYRLGPFGWLSLAQYGGKLKDATNLGLQDMIMALKWIRKNIEKFGGDPNNVTVTGHSAGAFSTLSLLAAPTAKGLFQHIAAFSGMPSRQVPAWNAEERTLSVLKALDCVDDPEKLLTVDGNVLADAMSKTQANDPGVQHGVDNNVIAVVDDSYLPNGVINSHPMKVLESGMYKDIDIIFSSTSAETYWWVLNKPDAFNPGSINDLVEEFAHSNRIPISRARDIVASYNVDDRSPLEVRSALLTDFSFTLPQTRGAVAHANAGGKVYLMAVGPVKGADVAVHGTEMYGIVGQTAPGSEQEQITRDNTVRDAILELAEGKVSTLKATLPNELNVNGIGNLPYDATEHAQDVLRIFKGIERP